MKKNYLIAIAVFLSTSVFAQLSLVTTFTAANELKQEQIREDNYFQGHVFYFGQGSTTSSQLYKTDGNTITLVKDFGPVYPEGETATGISISNFNQTSDKLFFTRYSMRFGTTAPLDAISELWTSDGTTEGTIKLASYRYAGTSRSAFVLSGESGGTYHKYQNSIGNKLIFNGYDSENPGNTLIMWVSDGTAAGTKPLLDNGGGKVYGGVFFGTRMNGKYYFGARPQNSIDPGGHLYETDGTNSGTKKVNSGLFYMSSNTSEPLNGKMLFWANTVNENYGLWESDGTDAGTKPFAGLPGTTGKKTYYLTGIDMANDGKQVYFTIQPTAEVKTAEIWATDFTPGNTRKIRDESIFLPSKIELGDGFVYILYWDSNLGASAKFKLGYSDGTFSGTKTLLEESASASSFGLYQNSLYFPQYESKNGFLYSNVELWSSDGTAENTKMLHDIYPGEVTFYNPPYKLSSNPRSFFVLENVLYFVAKNGNNTNLYRFKSAETSVDAIGSGKNNRSLNVFPNPCTDYVSIHSAGNDEWTLTSLQGKVVMRTELKEGNNVLNVYELPKGIYLGIIRNKITGATSSGKIIKK